MDERHEGQTGVWSTEIRAEPSDTPPIERNWQRLDAAISELSEVASRAFVRFEHVLSGDDRAELREGLARVKFDSGSSTLALRLDQHALQVETIIERLRDLISRCEL